MADSLSHGVVPTSLLESTQGPGSAAFQGSAHGGPGTEDIPSEPQEGPSTGQPGTAVAGQNTDMWHLSWAKKGGA